MRPIIKKLGHLGIAAVFSLVVVIGLSTCGGKQKRQPGSLPEEVAAPAEGAAAKGEATKGEEVMGTNPTVAYGDDTGVAGQENFSVFQLGNDLGSDYRYDGAAQVSNVSVAAVTPLTQPREVVEKASECKSPGRLIAEGSVISVCVGETKVIWDGVADRNYIIKADDEMAITVLSKPKYIESFVGIRDASEKFSGSKSTQKGNSSLFLGPRSFDAIKAADASGADKGVSPPPAAADSAFVVGLRKDAPLVIKDPTGRDVPPTGPPQNHDPNAVAGDNVTLNDDTKGILQADTIGYYVADSSVIDELNRDGGKSLGQRTFSFVPTDNLRGLQFLNGGYTVPTKKWGVCSELKIGNVLGIKVFHLFVETPAASDNCSSQADKSVTIAFPKLKLKEINLGGRDSALFFINQPIQVNVQSTTGRIDMGIEGWEAVNSYTTTDSVLKYSANKMFVSGSLTAQEYDSIDTSVELILAPALLDMKDGKPIHAAHLFIPLTKHNPDNATTDMKNKKWKVRISSQHTLGVFSLGGVAPFHTLTLQSHLAQWGVGLEHVTGKWVPADDKAKEGAMTPKLLKVDSAISGVDLNPISQHAGWCGFEVFFAPVGNEDFELVIALNADFSNNSLFGVSHSFSVESLVDFKRVLYTKHEEATCIAESGVELETGEFPGIQKVDRIFDPITAGSTVTMTIKASHVVASPTPAASP